MAKRDPTTRAGTRKRKPRVFDVGVEEKVGVEDKVDGRAAYNVQVKEIVGARDYPPGGRPRRFGPDLVQELRDVCASLYREHEAQGRRLSNDDAVYLLQVDLKKRNLPDDEGVIERQIVRPVRKMLGITGHKKRKPVSIRSRSDNN
jgi:hypothetical protein